MFTSVLEQLLVIMSTGNKKKALAFIDRACKSKGLSSDERRKLLNVVASNPQAWT